MRPGKVFLSLFACVALLSGSSRAAGESPAYSLWNTYLGGSANDGAYAIASDAQGNVFVGGQTVSFDFLSAAGVDPIETYGGYDAVVIKLAPDGSTVTAAFSIGGPGNDGIWDLKVTENGDVIVLGDVGIGYVPPGDACTSGTGGGTHDIILARLDNDLDLQAIQIIGGSGDDVATDLDVTGDGIASVLVNTTSRDLETTPGAFQDAFQGGATDYFVARVDLTPGRSCEERLVYATYVGGSATEEPAGIQTNAGLAADSAGLVTIAGRTSGGGPTLIRPRSHPRAWACTTSSSRSSFATRRSSLGSNSATAWSLGAMRTSLQSGSE